MNVTITDIEVKDIRFPTSRELHGSDAMNPDPDYSAAYVILKTNKEGLEGHGLTFTIGRGNDLCGTAIQALTPMIIGQSFDRITENFGTFWKKITGDSQLRWLGPEKGVIHLATGAVVNALWDLYAKIEKKPLWLLLADMSPEELVRCIDFTYITDAITPEEALQILQKLEPTKQKRIEQLQKEGYPAYTTSAGWLGYSDQKIRCLSREAVQEGWIHIKMKVGADLEDDVRRAEIIRQEIGYDIKLMMDVNQKWEVNEAISKIKTLARFKPWWIEEPTSPDDILGHSTIARAIAPIKVATGEHCQNRIMFKQMMQAGALDVCQIDSCRVGGVNEILAILLMAAKYDIPVCPHAGGVGLCEYVQHLSMFDYIAISGSLENRMIEYVDHLHEHFLDPVIIRNGCYMPPQKPGYSIEMKKDTLIDYIFPDGKIWQKILEGTSELDRESCMTMNNTWGYKKTGHNWKTSEVLIHNLIDIAAKGGNYLLNVGPAAEGLIPQPSVERLAAMEAWLDVNGEAIYETERLQHHFKQGKNIRYTRKKGESVYYAISLEAPGGTINFKYLRPAEGSEIQLLGYDAPLEWSFDDKEGLTVEIPTGIGDNPQFQQAMVFRVEGEEVN